MTAADPLAAERFRTIVAEAIDKPGMDAPWQEAEPIVGRFPNAYFEYRTNEHGVRVRRVVVASEWEVDPTSAPPAESDAGARHPFVGTRYKGREVDTCSHVAVVAPGLGVMCHAPSGDPVHGDERAAPEVSVPRDVANLAENLLIEIYRGGALPAWAKDDQAYGGRIERAARALSAAIERADKAHQPHV